MRRSVFPVSVLVVGGLFIGVSFGTPAFAAEKHEEYKSPGSNMRVLLKEPLHGVKGETVTIAQVTFPPAWVGGQHYHSGPVYVYVLKGDFVVHEKGKEPQTIAAGGLYREPIGNPMEARNASTSEATEILLMQVGHEGEPMMIKTKF